MTAKRPTDPSPRSRQHSCGSKISAAGMMPFVAMVTMLGPGPNSGQGTMARLRGSPARTNSRRQGWVVAHRAGSVHTGLYEAGDLADSAQSGACRVPFESPGASRISAGSCRSGSTLTDARHLAERVILATRDGPGNERTDFRAGRAGWSAARRDNEDLSGERQWLNVMWSGLRTSG